MGLFDTSSKRSGYGMGLKMREWLRIRISSQRDSFSLIQVGSPTLLWQKAVNFLRDLYCSGMVTCLSEKRKLN